MDIYVLHVIFSAHISANYFIYMPCITLLHINSYIPNRVKASANCTPNPSKNVTTLNIGTAKVKTKKCINRAKKYIIQAFSVVIEFIPVI